MKKNTITVTISGPQSSGKSCLASILVEALKRHSHKVYVSDDVHVYPGDHAYKDILDNVRILIEEQQDDDLIKKAIK